MKPAKILLPMQDREDMEPIANTAFVLAERFGAEVEGLHAFTPARDEIQLYYEAAGPAYHEALLKEAEVRREAAQKRSEELFAKLSAPHAGVTSKFLPLGAGVLPAVAQRGRLADLVVIGTEPKDVPGIWLDIRDAALFQTGRPVVVAPPVSVPVELGKRVLIAWKDSVEAARAISAAWPFIEAAKSVHLVSVGSDAVPIERLKDVQAYLSLHVDSVKAEIVGADKSNAAELLLEEAAKHPDTLLVMGAYSHWRWKEWIFGGVTEYVLQASAVPVLMAH